jgi:hypothetical protein
MHLFRCTFTRRLDAIEHGYVSYLTAMERFASPKNHVLFGYYAGDGAPSPVSCLSTSIPKLQLDSFDRWLNSFQNYYTD